MRYLKNKSQINKPDGNIAQELPQLFLAAIYPVQLPQL
jgi:hypothetical protein